MDLPFKTLALETDANTLSTYTNALQEKKMIKIKVLLTKRLRPLAGFHLQGGVYPRYFVYARGNKIITRL